MAKQKRIFRIHPAIGIARVGNADRSTEEGFFIGPETSGMPADWDPVAKKARESFKLNGAVKAQAARFRIWEYEIRMGKLTPKGEVTLDSAEIVDIGWSIHLANRKASFFEFHGQRGAADDFAALERRNPKQPGIRRNPGIEKEQRIEKLEIDPEPQSISGKNKVGVHFLNKKKHIPIPTLGELRTD